MAAPGLDGNLEATDTVPQDDDRPRRGRTALILLLVFVVLAACWLLSTMTAVVPNVTGKTTVAARKTLDQAGFNVEVEVSDGTTGTVESAIVESQSPRAGWRVLKGTAVTLNVLGKGAGTDFGESSTSDNTNDFSYAGELAPSPDLSSPPGVTYGYIPGQSGTAPDGRPVIPLVGGVPKDAALATLQTAGFNPVVGGYGYSTTGVPPGSVYFQQPPFNSRAALGSTVMIYISLGVPKTDGAYKSIP